jgi:hypothetical protein
MKLGKRDFNVNQNRALVWAGGGAIRHVDANKVNVFMCTALFFAGAMLALTTD